ncbi:MAG: hypothetical protein IJ213_02900 [Bacteroidales bacterium]|nr:hypothetical protein [Bacteroidales bacterium]
MEQEILKINLTDEFTDELLSQIMHDVNTEVKQKNDIAMKEHYAKLRQSVSEISNSVNSIVL